MSTVAERKARYEESALKQLFDKSGHTICVRCYCCDVVSESAPCWQCGGFADEDDDWDDVCSVCDGDGEIYWDVCIGNCDENGEHKAKSAPPEPAEGKKG